MKINLDNYEIDILVSGYPGRSVYHAGLGWSTVALIRGAGRTVLIDGGAIGMRGLLISRMAERKTKPAEVTHMLITHAHHDHLINWTLFRHARIIIGALELDWALKSAWGETPVPELYARELRNWPTLQTVTDGEEVLPGISAHLTPGHTPGHLVFVLHGAAHDVIFTGDAAKNRVELLTGKTDMTYDAAISAATVATIGKLWRARSGSILIPGHDLPMVLEQGVCRYMGHRQAAITAWYGDDLETTTRFELTK
jgi:glyoxylase-like metal-dependent hydrolase (beta-lactamase superfamily II)